MFTTCVARYKVYIFLKRMTILSLKEVMIYTQIYFMLCKITDQPNSIYVSELLRPVNQHLMYLYCCGHLS